MTDNQRHDSKVAIIGACIVAGIVVLGLTALLLLALFRPDASATFITHASTLIGLAITAGGVFFVGQRTNNRLEQVAANTNGKNDRLQAERDQARDALTRLGLDVNGNPLPTPPATGSTPTT